MDQRNIPGRMRPCRSFLRLWTRAPSTRVTAVPSVTRARRRKKSDAIFALSGAISGLIDGALRLYQLIISPLLGVMGVNCRFYPSCSTYARQAIRKHGVTRGSWLALKRLCRCHPLCDGGYDPLP